MTLTRFAALGALTALLAGCAAEPPDQPFGAPPPDHNDMTFVDLDGCRWWVIGNALNRSWARQTGTDGKPLCRDEGVFGDQATGVDPAAGTPAPASPDVPASQAPVQLVPAEAPTPSAGAPTSAAAPAPSAGVPTSAAAPASAPAPTAAPLAPTPGATIAPQVAAVPQVAPEQAPVATGAAGPFFVQVASFKELANADASAANFVALGYPVAGDPAAADANGLYGLTLGPFVSSADASAALQQVRTEGFADAFIRRQRP